MDNDIPEIKELIKQFSRLPGLGPKSAKRIILKLINNKDNMVKPLAKSLAQVYKKVVRCVDCGNLKIIDRICICSSDNSYDKICVVENLADMWVIDSANIYKGHYHILGGTLNSNESYEHKNLLIESLVKRIKKNNLKEVIIATSATVEGQTTAHYIEDTIKNGNNFTGFKVKPNDPQALSIAIKQSITMDKKDLTKMHERAISNVKNNFSLENMCKKTLEVYKRLLISE